MTESQSNFDPLSYAIQSRKLESVECLVSYGFDVNREKIEGVSPMMQALVYEELDIALAIREAGGVWVMESPHMDGCLAKAIELDGVELLKDALAQGWEDERKLFRSMTLLDVARFYGAAGIEQFLEEKAGVLAAEQKVGSKEVDERPKLLRRVQVDYPTEMQRKFGSRTIALSVMLDTEGIPRLVKFKSEEPREVKSAVERAVKRWRLSPAINENAAVPTSLSFNLPLEAAMDPANVFDMAVLSERPSALSQVDPNYPYFLHKSRIEGWVTVDFIIGPNGGVVDAIAVTSSHSEFEEPAVHSIYRSRWKPGKVNGKPVSVRARQRILFRL